MHEPRVPRDERNAGHARHSLIDTLEVDATDSCVRARVGNPPWLHVNHVTNVLLYLAESADVCVHTARVHSPGFTGRTVSEFFIVRRRERFNCNALVQADPYVRFHKRRAFPIELSARSRPRPKKFVVRMARILFTWLFPFTERNVEGGEKKNPSNKERGGLFPDVFVCFSPVRFSE